MSTIISGDPRSPDEDHSITAVNDIDTSRNVASRHKDGPVYLDGPVREEGMIRTDDHTVQSDMVKRRISEPVRRSRPLNISNKSRTYPDNLNSVAYNTEPPGHNHNHNHDHELSTLEGHCGDILTKPTSSAPSSDKTPASSPVLPPQESQPEPEEVIHVLAPSLFDNEYPYKLFLGNYKILEPIIVLFLIFQTLTSIFITLCEEGGAFAVFHNGLNIPEFINRILTFLLRGLFGIIAPFIFYRQICSMAEAEKALYIKKKKNEDYISPSPQPVPYHNHVSLWSIISHAVLFSAILLYLDAFLTAEERLSDRGICIREIFQIQVPMIRMQFFVLCNFLACFFILMLVGLVKDCYCIENLLSTENSKYFDIVRRRWYRIDALCYIFPSIIILFTITSLSCNIPLIPTPPGHRLGEGDLEMWCFWMITLSLLLFFGSSSNWTAKFVSVFGNVLALCCAAFFTMVLNVDKIRFPPGTFVIVMYSHLTITTINLLYCLMKTHYRHKRHKSVRFWLSLTFWVLLIVCLFAVVIREVICLAAFIVWL